MDEDHEECVFSEVLCDASDHMDYQGIDDYNIARERLSKLVRLFLNYGMLNHLFYDTEEEKELLPLWKMQFCCCKDAALALKMILDEGYRGDSVDDFIEHFFLDAEHCDPFSLDDEYYLYHLEWGIRMTMLIASYPDIIENDEYVRDIIHLEENNKNLINTFRDIDRYEYSYEYSQDVHVHNRNLALVYIKDGDKIVWTLDI